MTLAVVLYWSVRSPYCYVLGPRVQALSEMFAVEVALKVVHPAALRRPERFAEMRANALARPHFLMDSAREAARHGLPFRRPTPDPVAWEPETLVPATEQPRARRLGRLCALAETRGAGLAFTLGLARLLWDGAVEDWEAGVHLAKVADAAGLDLADMEAEIAGDPDRWERTLAANDDALRAAGHWGVPTLVFEGEPFFGQDRFETLLWRLGQRGLALR